MNKNEKASKLEKKAKDDSELNKKFKKLFKLLNPPKSNKKDAK